MSRDRDLRPISERVAHWEWALLGLLCLGCLIHWLPHYHGFVLPNSDFGSFRRAAEALWSGELPSNFKRMPLFPLLMGGVAQLLPVDRPLIHAGLSLNLLLSLGMLLCVFLLGRGLIGVAALVPAVAMAGSYAFHHSALQPLVEPTLGLGIAAALLLFARGSRWCYLAAGLAAIARYEASGLIALFFVLDTWRDRRPLRYLVPAALASSGFLLWMGLSLMSHSGGNPYLSQISDMSEGADSGPVLAWPMVPEIFRAAYMDRDLDWFAVPLFVWGVVVSLRRFPLPSLAILGFLLLYTAAHVAFGVTKSIYAHPVVWMPAFYMTVGGRDLLERVAPLRERLPPAALAALLGAVAAAALGFLVPEVRDVFRTTGSAPKAFYGGHYLLLLALLGVGFYLGVRRWGAAPLLGLPLAAGMAGLVSCSFEEAMERHVKARRKTSFSKYQYWVGLRWLDEHLEPDEKALTFGTFGVRRTGIDPDRQLVGFGHLKAETHDELVREIAEREVDYVVYWYRRGKPEPGTLNYERNLYYYTKYKVYLAEPFSRGEPLPHFEHLATLPLPPAMDKPAVQVYRFLGLEGTETASRAEAEVDEIREAGP